MSYRRLIQPSFLDREFRDAMHELLTKAEKEVILFENPGDGLCYMIVDRKHLLRWIEPDARITFLYVKKKEIREDGKTSTIETLYGCKYSTGKKTAYARLERLKNGSYMLKISKHMKQITNRLRNFKGF